MYHPGPGSAMDGVRRLLLLAEVPLASPFCAVG